MPAIVVFVCDFRFVFDSTVHSMILPHIQYIKVGRNLNPLKFFHILNTAFKDPYL